MSDEIKAGDWVCVIGPSINGCRTHEWEEGMVHCGPDSDGDLHVEFHDIEGEAYFKPSSLMKVLKVNVK